VNASQTATESDEVEADDDEERDEDWYAEESARTAIMMSVEPSPPAETSSESSVPTSTPATPASETQPVAPSPDPGAWLESARASIKAHMLVDSAASQRQMEDLSQRLEATLTDLQALAGTQRDQEWYTLLGMAYAIKGKVDAALAEIHNAQPASDQ
jgi:hypothetical protein